MINDNTDHGEIVVNEGKATSRLQNFFDSITLNINSNKDPIYMVATVPDATKNEAMTIYVLDETGGATLAFSDGTNWLRCYDRVIIS